MQIKVKWTQICIGHKKCYKIKWSFAVRMKEKMAKDKTSVGDIYQPLKQNMQTTNISAHLRNFSLSFYVSHVENEIFLFFS